ncbi:MAG: DsrE family protein [Armatimonadota bacterium]
MNDVVLIGSQSMGSPDEKLGHLLLGNFLRILGDREELPKYIVLWNSGVKNAVSNSDTLDYLKTLQNRGVEIISCRTCVEYFGLDDDMAVGIVDGMARIIEILTKHQVLTI